MVKSLLHNIVKFNSFNICFFSKVDAVSIVSNL